MDSRYAIETRKLNLWYGTFQALFDIDLQVKSGIITSLIGPSGCGKSTILRSFNRINERLNAVLQITGKDASHWITLCLDGQDPIGGQLVDDPGDGDLWNIPVQLGHAVHVLRFRHMRS